MEGCSRVLHGAGWGGGEGRDRTNGDWASPDSSGGVAVVARRAVCCAPQQR